MKLQSLQLNNFLSHEDTTIEFHANQQVLIDGVSGSGKSAICDALVWCLYGKGRMDNRSLIKHGANSASIVLQLVDDNNIYQITRSITQSGKHDVKVEVRSVFDGSEFVAIHTTGVKETQAHIEKVILRSSYLLFVNSVLYPQDNPNSFVRQTAAKRKDLILEIANTLSFDEYYKTTKNVLSARKDKMIETKTLMDSLATKVEENKKVADTVDALKGETELLKVKRDALQSVSEVQKREYDTWTLIETAHKDAVGLAKNLAQKIYLTKGNIASYNPERLQELSKELKGYSDVPERMEAAMEEAKKEMEWDKAYIGATYDAPAFRDYKAEIDEVNKQIITLMSVVVEPCPEIGKVCPRITKDRDAQVASLQTTLESRAADLIEYTKLKQENDEKVAALGERPTTAPGEEIKALSDREKEMKKLMEQIKTLEKESQDTLSSFNSELAVQESKLETALAEESKHWDVLTKNKEKFDSLGTLAKLKTETEAKLTVTSSEYEHAIKKLAVAELAASTLTEDNSALDKYKLNWQNIEEDMESLTLLKEAFSPKGVKAIVVDHLIPRLEEKINDILSKLSDFRVQLDTQRKGLDEESVVEGLFISIFNENGEEFDFEGYSGGEKLKIIVSISEALAEIQKAEFRVLDELFIGLDEDSTDKFAEIVMTLQERFSQMVCISHLKNIKGMFGETILVTKRNGNSTIAYDREDARREIQTEER